MDFKEMSIEQLEERQAEIRTEIEAPEADLEALKEEVRGIKEEMETRKAEAEKKAQLRQMVSEIPDVPAVKVIEEPVEVRSTAAYAEAYKNYILTGDDTECRTLVKTTNASGIVPVPEIVEQAVKTAWEKNEVTARLNKTSFRGNFKAVFERSATGAYVHAEGTTAPTEEELQLGIVTLIPANVKKWITITDEVAAMGGQEFLSYLYDEITYQIVKKVEALAINDITTANTTHGATAIGVPAVVGAPGAATLVEAVGNLTDNASDKVIVMNRLTYVEFYKAYEGGNFAVEATAGLPVVYSDALPAYSTASANAVYAIVGDLKGEQINYPEGDGVVLKWDDLSKAEFDLIKVVGRQYAGHGVTRPGCLVNILKPAAVTT